MVPNQRCAHVNCLNSFFQYIPWFSPGDPVSLSSVFHHSSSQPQLLLSLTMHLMQSEQTPSFPFCPYLSSCCLCSEEYAPIFYLANSYTFLNSRTDPSAVKTFHFTSSRTPPLYFYSILSIPLDKYWIPLYYNNYCIYVSLSILLMHSQSFFFLYH